MPLTSPPEKNLIFNIAKLRKNLCFRHSNYYKKVHPNLNVMIIFAKTRYKSTKFVVVCNPNTHAISVKINIYNCGATISSSQTVFLIHERMACPRPSTAGICLDASRNKPKLVAQTLNTSFEFASLCVLSDRFNSMSNSIIIDELCSQHRRFIFTVISYARLSRLSFKSAIIFFCITVFCSHRVHHTCKIASLTHEAIRLLVRCPLYQTECQNDGQTSVRHLSTAIILDSVTAITDTIRAKARFNLVLLLQRNCGWRESVVEAQSYGARRAILVRQTGAMIIGYTPFYNEDDIFNILNAFLLQFFISEKTYNCTFTIIFIRKPQGSK